MHADYPSGVPRFHTLPHLSHTKSAVPYIRLLDVVVLVDDEEEEEEKEVRVKISCSVAVSCLMVPD